MGGSHPLRNVRLSSRKGDLMRCVLMDQSGLSSQRLLIFDRFLFAAVAFAHQVQDAGKLTGQVGECLKQNVDSLSHPELSDKQEAVGGIEIPLWRWAKVSQLQSVINRSGTRRVQALGSMEIPRGVRNRDDAVELIDVAYHAAVQFDNISEVAQRRDLQLAGYRACDSAGREAVAMNDVGRLVSNQFGELYPKCVQGLTRSIRVMETEINGSEFSALAG